MKSLEVCPTYGVSSRPGRFRMLQTKGFKDLIKLLIFHYAKSPLASKNFSCVRAGKIFLDEKSNFTLR